MLSRGVAARSSPVVSWSYLCARLVLARKNVCLSRRVFIAVFANNSCMTRVAIGIFCLLLFTAAVCSPQQAQDFLSSGTQYTFDERQVIDYSLVIDRSGSMRVGGRFSEAQRAATDFVHELARGDRAGVIGFDSRSVLYQRFSADQEEVISSIDSMTIGDWTQYNEGLYRALEEFSAREEQDNRGIIIFMSDGRPDDNTEVLEQAVTDVLAADLCVYTIAYAEEADEQAQEVLADIASRSEQATGCGGYFRAEEDTYDLSRIYRQIYLETASNELINVSVDVDTSNEVTLDATLSSSLNQQPLSGLACFEPQLRVVITRSGQAVFEQETTSSQITTDLQQGVYDYQIVARETCGGACDFYGSASGQFTVSEGARACDSSFNQILSTVRSVDEQEVRITPSGFEPRNLSAHGVVSFTNELSRPIYLVGTGEYLFESFLMQPGQSWRYAFDRGDIEYTDSEADFSSGVIRSTPLLRAPGAGVDLALVLDTSGSMAGEQMRVARESSQSLARQMRSQDRAGVVTFSSTAHTLLPLSSEFDRMQRRLASVRSGGATSYVSALEELPGLFRDSRNDKRAVLFVSDGVPTDRGGVDAVLASLEENLPAGVCLYTVGYGSEGVLAVGALEAMAQYSQEVNGCGLFYYAPAQQEYLSRVLGEVLALEREQELEVFDVSSEQVGEERFEVSVRVRSAHNEVEVPAQAAACIPEASVYAFFGPDRTPLAYNEASERYEGVVRSEDISGALVVASLVDEANPSRVVAGSYTFSSQEAFAWWELLGLGVLVLLSAKIFISGLRRLQR